MDMLYIVFDQFIQYLGQEKTHCTFIVNRSWRESRIPSLLRVLLFLVQVGVPKVSWVFRQAWMES